MKALTIVLPLLLAAPAFAGDAPAGAATDLADGHQHHGDDPPWHANSPLVQKVRRDSATSTSR